MHVCEIDDAYLHAGHCCFNSSILCDGSGRVLLFYRVTRDIPSWFDSRVFARILTPRFIASTLWSSIKLIKPEESEIEQKVSKKQLVPHGEDPRAVFLPRRRKIAISYTFVPTILNLEADIHMTLFNVDTLEPEKTLYLPELNAQQKKQKNWAFFENGPCLYLLYSILPEMRIFKVDESQDTAELICAYDWSVDLPCKRPLGLRGGTPPIYVDKDGLFYVFAHSIGYRTFAFVFRPDFSPVGVSSEPLLTKHRTKCRVHFPAGGYWDRSSDSFILSLGIDDHKTALAHLSRNEVKAGLLPPATVRSKNKCTS